MTVYQFGSFQLDADAIRLYKKNTEIELEPQVFNTLLYLVENHHRVVDKDELFEQVWHGRKLTDNVITRTVYELRKALDQNEHSLIRTVRRKGYQFIAEVTVNYDINPTIREHSVNDAIKHQNPPNFLFWSIALLFITLGGFFWYKWHMQEVNTTSKTAVLAEQTLYPIVTVLPIEVEAGNEELLMLMHSLLEYLTNQLTVNLNMKVIHPDSLVNMADQLDDVWAIQKATRSDFIIQGFIESVTEQSIKLHLTLYKTGEDGELRPFTLGAFQLTYPKDAKTLNFMYKERKLTVRSIIEIIKPGVTLRDSGRTETSDPEAYRLVIAAHHVSQNDDCKDLQRAEVLLLKAVQKDEEFAYAYYQLFVNYFKRVWLCGESKEYHQKALAMAEIVERLAPNVYSPMYKGVNAILIESNQVEKAYEISQDASWNDTDAINHKIYGLRYAGFLNLASTHIDRVLQLDPLYYSEKPINQSPNTLLYLNQFSEFMSLLSVPGSSYHDYYRGLALALSNDSGESIKVLQGVIDRQPKDLFGRFSKALLHILANEDEAAVAIIDAIMQKRFEIKHSDGEMTYKLVQLYALANRPELALDNFQIAVDQGFFPMNYFLHDPALKSIQNKDRFASIIKQATERHSAFAERFNLKSEQSDERQF